MRDPVLKYARSNGLVIREDDFAFHIEIPKEDLLIEVTVLKTNRVLEWFATAYDAATREELYSSYVPHFATEGESREEVAQELDAAALATVKALHQNEVRIAETGPLFRLFGRSFFRGPILQYRSEQGWKSYDDVDLSDTNRSA